MAKATHWARARSARAISSRDALVLVGERGSSIALEGDSGELAAAVIDYLSTPHTHDEVVAFVRSIAEGDFDPTVVDDLMRVLADAAIVVSGDMVPASEPDANPAGPTHRRVVLAVTGAIAAIDAPRAAIALQERGYEVWAVTTDAASHFVSREALSAITHKPTYFSMWGGSAERPAPHIDLAKWADLVIVYPASATTISRIATGDCSDIVSALAIATRAPVLIAPSMNGAMLTAPSVARNLETLRDDGFYIVHPSLGVEVADRPNEREQRIGPALRAEAFVELVTILASRLPSPPRETSAQEDRISSSSEVDWERVHLDVPKADQPWHSDEVDALLESEMALFKAPIDWLDLGTGYGTLAIAAAKMGHHVVATDISRRALEGARARALGLSILFVRDDVTRSNLIGQFDVVTDRGVLHVLSPAEVNQYSETLARLVVDGGHVILVIDAVDAPTHRKTLRFDPSELSSMLPGFELVRQRRTAITKGETETAWLCVLRRVLDAS